MRKIRVHPILAIALAAVVAAVIDPGFRGVLITGVSEAWLTVGSFVAATLGLVYGVEKVFKLEFANWLKPGRRGSVTVAALLGAFPGCGGAIVVTLSFFRGQATMGGLVAALTETMGDSAFLLLGRQPLVALGVIAVQIAVGVVTGTLVDAVHGKDFMRQSKKTGPLKPECDEAPSLLPGALLTPWLLFTLATLIAGIWLIMGDNEQPPTLYWAGLLGGATMIVRWLKDPSENPDLKLTDNASQSWHSIISRVFEETAFVTSWVAVAYVLFGAIQHLAGVDVEHYLDRAAMLLPLATILIGFIPSCGPQIVVASMYLNGLIPFSAMIGNLISTDGDALVPAMKLSPAVIIIATLYSAVPALVVAYGWLFIFER